MKQILALLHSEVVGIYSGLNSILGALVVLHAFTLTPDQIAAVLVIANVVVGPIVRGLVTPTSVRKAATVGPVVPVAVSYSAPPGAVIGQNAEANG